MRKGQGKEMVNSKRTNGIGSSKKNKQVPMISPSFSNFKLSIIHIDVTGQILRESVTLNLERDVTDRSRTRKQN